MEAALNIIISVILVNRYGIIGVAVGTLVSMSLRMICQILYLRNNILKRKARIAFKNIAVFSITTVILLSDGKHTPLTLFYIAKKY